MVVIYVGGSMKSYKYGKSINDPKTVHSQTFYSLLWSKIFVWNYKIRRQTSEKQEEKRNNKLLSENVRKESK